MAEHDAIFVKNSTTVDTNKLDSLLKQFGSARYELNKSSIEDDIKKLERRKTEIKNKAYVNGCNEVIKYLQSLHKVSDKTIAGSIKMNGHNFMEYPVMLKRFPQFFVQAVDSININGNNCLDGTRGLIHVNVDHVLDALAIEVAKFDLDISIEEIEEKFKDCGIVEVCEGERFLQLGKDKCVSRNNGDIFNSCCEMYIEKSEYASVAKDGKAYSYFGAEVKDKARYSSLLIKSAEELMRILVASELGRLREKKLNSIRLISVSNGLITYGVSSQYTGSIDTVVNIINETIVLKLVGRKFAFKPTITTISVEGKED